MIGLKSHNVLSIEMKYSIKDITAKITKFFLANLADIRKYRKLRSALICGISERFLLKIYKDESY